MENVETTEDSVSYNYYIIISEPRLMNFERKFNIVFQIMKEWFNSNFLSLNFDKTYYMQFITKNKFLNKINIEHDNKMILQTNFVKFFGYNNR